MCWGQGPPSLSAAPLTLLTFRVLEAPLKAFLRTGAVATFSVTCKLGWNPSFFDGYDARRGMLTVTGTGRVFEAGGVRGVWGGSIRINHMVKIEVEDHSR